MANESKPTKKAVDTPTAQGVESYNNVNIKTTHSTTITMLKEDYDLIMAHCLRNDKNFSMLMKRVIHEFCVAKKDWLNN
jgi:hypothetical protein